MIGRLVRRLARGDAEPPREEPPFLGGLLLGALVGAAIAGSTLWRTRRRRSGRPATGGDEATTTGA